LEASFFSAGEGGDPAGVRSGEGDGRWDYLAFHLSLSNWKALRRDMVSDGASAMVDPSLF